MTTDILGLSELTENQSSKYLTHNEALRQLEAFLVRVLSRTTGLSEITPSNGDVYIINDCYDDNSQWQASTAYTVDDIVVPTTHNGYRYKCTSAGTSGSTEPTWPTTIGNTVVDNGVTWECDNGIWPASANYDTNDIVYYYSSAWHYYSPVAGLSIWCADESVRIYYSGSAWQIAFQAKLDLNVTLNDHDAVGILDTFQVDANATGFGAAMYVAADGHLEEADAGSSSTLRCMGLALDAGTGSGKRILRWGRIRDDSWSWTVGDPVFVSTTAGGLTQTAPSGSGEFVQVVGEAEASNIIMFAPSYDVIERS